MFGFDVLDLVSPVPAKWCQDDPNGSPSRELEETTRASPCHVAEHQQTRPESLQPHTEWSSRSGSESPSVEADVYVWRYTFLVVHARKERATSSMFQTCILNSPYYIGRP